MGNELSHEQGGRTRQPAVSFGRRGALGLSKSELERRCKPSGLYPSCQWEEKAIRKLIGDGRLAARLRGTDQRKTLSDRECPICFLQYSQINVTQCCRANICTECFLQVRPQKEKHCVCPFCNNNKLYVCVAKSLNSEQIAARQEAEQQMIEATIKARSNDSGSDRGSTDDELETFGSSLQSQQQAMARAMSSANDTPDSDYATLTDTALIRQVSMTEQDRRALEQEMRAQHIHPLALQMEMEAEERRIANEREFYRSQSERGLFRSGNSNFGGSGRRMMVGGRGMPGRMGTSTRSGRRNWNEIVDSFERGGNGEVNSLDDLVVLEAAMILSMEEEARRREEQQGGAGGVSGRQDEEIDFDANRHARDGFPLVHEYLSRTSSAAAVVANGGGGGGTESGTGGGSTDGGAGGGSSDWSNDGTSSLGNASFRGRVRHATRGLTEDEQMAMAIALSMQDSARHLPCAEATTQTDEGSSSGSSCSSDGGDGTSRNKGSIASESKAAIPKDASSKEANTSSEDETTAVEKTKKKKKKKKKSSSAPPRPAPPDDNVSPKNASKKKQQNHPSLNESFSAMDELPKAPARTGSSEIGFGQSTRTGSLEMSFGQPSRTGSLDISFAEDSMAEVTTSAVTTLPTSENVAKKRVVPIAEEGEEEDEDDDGDPRARMLTVDRTPSKVTGETPDSANDRKMPARDSFSDEEEDRKMPAKP